jgi:hypothetical protein
MERNKTTLMAFAGPEIEQDEKIYEISSGYECWNLKKFNFDEFIEALKKKIPPVNNNVIRNYKLANNTTDIYGLTEDQFKDCSWALFIPDYISDSLVDGYSESIFLLNLYSPSFLYPYFYVGDMGIIRLHNENRVSLKHTSYWHEQNQAHLFKDIKFVSFFKVLLVQSGYGTWMLYRAQKWEKEDWRLFVASKLFFEFKKI